MSNMRGINIPNNTGYPPGKQLLPPKSPLPIMPMSSTDHPSSHHIGQKGISRPIERPKQHQHTSSESFLVEEQPPWLDDLLNEPETPVRRGAHRRSSSDSVAYLDPSVYSNIFSPAQTDSCKYTTLSAHTSWGSEDFDCFKDLHQSSHFPEANLLVTPQSGGWQPFSNTVLNLPSPKDRVLNLPSPKDRVVQQGPSSAPNFVAPTIVKENKTLMSMAVKNIDREESTRDNNTLQKKEDSHVNNLQLETEQKRVKQQFAQRSRVRKLQYISELERHVQALQMDRSGVSAEMEFLIQQNLMLNLENKALHQRFDNLQQEHLIKCFQQETLDREIARLRALYHHQHQQHQSPCPPTHGRSRSSDLDSQFANLSLKRQLSSGGDPFNGTVHI